MCCFNCMQLCGLDLRHMFDAIKSAVNAFYVLNVVKRCVENLTVQWSVLRRVNNP